MDTTTIVSLCGLSFLVGAFMEGKRAKLHLRKYGRYLGFRIW